MREIPSETGSQLALSLAGASPMNKPRPMDPNERTIAPRIKNCVLMAMEVLIKAIMTRKSRLLRKSRLKMGLKYLLMQMGE